MASNPIAPLSFPTTPPMPAVGRILARYDRPQLAAFIAVAIDLLDTLGDDPEAEDSETDEAAGDEDDQAWTEWQTRGRHKLAGGMCEPVSIEDAEEDDSHDDSEGDCEHDGREPEDGF